MLDSVYAGITALTYIIQTVGNAAKWIFNLNYQFVSAVSQHLAWSVSVITYYAEVVKLALSTIWFYVVGFVTEIYLYLESVCLVTLKLATFVYKFASSVYLNANSACVAVSDFMISSFMFIRSTVLDMYNLFSAGASHSISFIVAAWSSVFLLVASLGAVCVRFINTLWYGLGFLLSSVAYFPTFLSQSAERTWNQLVESVAGVLTATTKETYLGIVMLCLIYLTLSNFIRFFSCRSLPLFSRRMRRRRQRAPGANPWHVDRGFESDFEDIYGPDEEERDAQPPWLNDINIEGAEHDQVDNSDTSDNDVSDNEDNGDDDANETDEYTVESENSGDDDDDDSDVDSVNSHNSQTFSTGSSEHDIEVQLPPLDQHYSLRSRSSTPARQADKLGTLNCPEDFSREMERERDKRKCVVCQDEIKCVLVLPCRHLCMCVVCADQIVRSRIPGRRTCPLCRTRITKVMNIYV